HFRAQIAECSSSRKCFIRQYDWYIGAISGRRGEQSVLGHFVAKTITPAIFIFLRLTQFEMVDIAPINSLPRLHTVFQIPTLSTRVDEEIGGFQMPFISRPAQSLPDIFILLENLPNIFADLAICH